MRQPILPLAMVLAVLIALPAAAGAPDVPATRPATWARWTVDDAPDTGAFSALQLGTGNLPHIAYRQSLPSPALRYAHAVTIGTGNCGPGLSFQCDTIESVSSIGFYVDIVLDPGPPPEPRISYNTGTLLKYAEYVGLGGTCGPAGDWRCDEIDGSDTHAAGDYSSIVLDPGIGNARISYYDQTYQDLRYAARGVAGGERCGPGGSWRCDTIEGDGSGPGEVGWETSLVLDGSGLGAIAYYCSTLDTVCERDLRIARQVGTGGNCGPTGDWNCYSVDTTGDVGWGPSLAIDTGGKLHVAYFACGDLAAGCTDVGDLRYAHEVTSGGNCGPSNTWQCDTIETGAAGELVGEYPSLALGAGNVPHVTYFDRAHGTLKLAYKVTSGGNCGPGGDTWHCETVAQAAPGEVVSSMDLAGGDFVHISYYDGPTGDLLYAVMRWVVALPILGYNAVP